MTPMPIFIPISNSGGGSGTAELWLAIAAITVLGTQYVMWGFILFMDDFKTRRSALLSLIPLSFIVFFVIYSFQKLRDLD